MAPAIWPCEKLIPALYQRFVAGQFDSRTRIMAAASTAMTRAEYAARAREHAREHLPATEFSEPRWREFAACLDYHEDRRDAC